MGKITTMSMQSCVSSDIMTARIQAVLEELRPAILQDGGDIHFVRFENGTVFVRLHGACVSCPISFITLKMGLEAQLKSKISGIESVVSVEDE
jgi:Fe-S cluster biogenesis protein NfuA